MSKPKVDTYKAASMNPKTPTIIYDVVRTRFGDGYEVWTCTCPWWEHHPMTDCKHIRAKQVEVAGTTKRRILLEDLFPA